MASQLYPCISFDGDTRQAMSSHKNVFGARSWSTPSASMGRPMPPLTGSCTLIWILTAGSG